MTALLSRLALAVALLTALGLGLYHLGGNAERTATKARELVVERDAHAQYRAEVERGAYAAASYAEAYQALQSNFQNLEGKFHDLRARVPLVVPRPVDRAGVVGASGDTAREPPPGEQPAMGRGGVDGGVLSAGAVWMWNSALAGADVPTGAGCAGDTSEAACAAGTGLGLEDAWQNHETNARLCAEDRFRQQRLIDFLKGRPAQ